MTSEMEKRLVIALEVQAEAQARISDWLVEQSKIGGVLWKIVKF